MSKQTKQAEQPIQVRDRRSPGWFWVDNDILEIYARRVGVYGFAIYNALSRYADNRTGRCFPSQARLAYLLGISENSVKRGLKALVREGLLSVAREGAGCKTPNIYTLLDVPELACANPPVNPVQNSVDKDRMGPIGTQSTSGMGPVGPLGMGPVGPMNKTYRTNKTKPIPAPTSGDGDSVGKDSPSKSESTHAAIRDLIISHHARANGMPAELVPWDGRAGKALAGLLEEKPELTVENAERCIRNFYLSDVNTSRHPAYIAGNLLEFWTSAVNEFGIPKPFSGKSRREARLNAEKQVGVYDPSTAPVVCTFCTRTIAPGADVIEDSHKLLYCSEEHKNQAQKYLQPSAQETRTA